MKNTILFLTLISVLQLSYGQVETKFFPSKNAYSKVSLLNKYPKTSIVKRLPTFDTQKLLDEDKLKEGLDVPYRFGKGFNINLTLLDGEWKNVEEGRLWSMRFQSKGAYSINFVFEKFHLSNSSKLYIANADGTMLYGAVTAKQNTANGYFLTDHILGDDVTIYLFEPEEEYGKSQLTIKRAVHAYKNLFSNLDYGNLGGSESCNNDIACFPAYDLESDAVALVMLSSGEELCSGSLLMTANQSFQSYFLSAFHCVDLNKSGVLSGSEISNAENWLFKFHYKKTICNGSIATTGITFNGAEFRAAWNTTDFVLMEMNGSPVGDTRFSWLGWDRSGNNPTSGIGLHHPSGDVMKISFDNDAIIETSEGSISTGTSHWFVDIDDGTFEGGSSGSPLLNEDDRVIGQLHSGFPGCSSSKRFWHGCFHRSWTGGSTNTTRLSNWLDPCGSGVLTTNTSRSPYISGSSLVCISNSTFLLSGLTSGLAIDWDCNTSVLTQVGGDNGSSYVVRANSSSTSGQGWVRATITSCGDTITLQKNVWVGKPSFYLDGDDELPAGSAGIALVEYAGDDSPYTQGVYDVDWSSTGGLSNLRGDLTKCQYIALIGGPAYIYADATNACGSIEERKAVDVTGGFFMLMPNPSDDYVEITTRSSIEGVNINSTQRNEPFETGTIRIFDSFGMIHTIVQLESKNQRISTSHLKDGVYVVEIKTKLRTERLNLLIKH